MVDIHGERAYWHRRSVSAEEEIPSQEDGRGISRLEEKTGGIQRVPRGYSIHNGDKGGGEPLWKVMAGRCTARDFLPKDISFEELSHLILATQGIMGTVYGLRLRVNRAVALSPGICHFNVRENELGQLTVGDLHVNIATLALGQSMAKEAAVYLRAVGTFTNQIEGMRGESRWTS